MNLEEFTKRKIKYRKLLDKLIKFRNKRFEMGELRYLKKENKIREEMDDILEGMNEGQKHYIYGYDHAIKSKEDMTYNEYKSYCDGMKDGLLEELLNNEK